MNERELHVPRYRGQATDPMGLYVTEEDHDRVVALLQTVPPAGEVEVVGYRIATTAPAVSGYTLTLNPVAEGKYQVPVVDFCHVTRLQAEVERQTEIKENNFGVILDLQQQKRELQAENAELSANLTKAWELLSNLCDAHENAYSDTRLSDSAISIVCAYLAHQTAPAAKGKQ